MYHISNKVSHYLVSRFWVHFSMSHLRLYERIYWRSFSYQSVSKEVSCTREKLKWFCSYWKNTQYVGRVKTAMKIKLAIFNTFLVLANTSFVGKCMQASDQNHINFSIGNNLGGIRSHLNVIVFQFCNFHFVDKFAQSFLQVMIKDLW